MQLSLTLLSALFSAQSCSAKWSIFLVDADKGTGGVCPSPTSDWQYYESDQDNDSACINAAGLSDLASCEQADSDGVVGECQTDQFSAKTAISDSSCLVYFGPDCTGGYQKTDYEGPCMGVDTVNGTFQSFRCDTDNVHSR